MSGKTDTAIPLWLEEAISLEKQGKIGIALDIVFDKINEFLVKAKFEQCDQLL